MLEHAQASGKDQIVGYFGDTVDPDAQRLAAAQKTSAAKASAGTQPPVVPAPAVGRPATRSR